MKKVRTFNVLSFLILTLLFSCSKYNSNSQSNDNVETTAGIMDSVMAIKKSDDEWRKILTSEQYHVLREKATDAPFTGKYYLSKDKGLYVCAACGNGLFTSDMKFESACGWPSFDKSVEGGKIKTTIDTSYGMVRTEILCGRCGSHLGHLFDDGPTLTGKRYCINSTSLNFKAQ